MKTFKRKRVGQTVLFRIMKTVKFKRKNVNLKRKHKNETFWTLADLCKILKSGRHQMLSKLSSLSISSLRILDEEANKFHDRKHHFYQTALLTRYKDKDKEALFNVKF